MKKFNGKFNEEKTAQLLDTLATYLIKRYKEEEDILNFAEDYYNNKLPKKYILIVKDVYNENIAQIVDDYIDLHASRIYPSTSFIFEYGTEKQILKGQRMRDLDIEILDYLKGNYYFNQAAEFMKDYQASELPNAIELIFERFYHKNVESLFDSYSDYLTLFD